MQTILKVSGLSACYKSHFRAEVKVLDNVGFRLNEGENLGIIGQIGSGKSTLSRLITNLGGVERTEGRIEFLYKGKLTDIHRIPNRYFRSHLQLVFQDCALALNPRLKIRQNLEEVYRINYPRKAVGKHIKALINSLALGQDILAKYPGDLSGGTQRRVFLGRALAGLGYLPELPGRSEKASHQLDPYPKLLILDELTRSLDAPLQHKIINFLAEAQPKLNLTCLIISHDYKIVSALCGQVIELRRGRLVERTKLVHPETAKCS